MPSEPIIDVGFANCLNVERECEEYLTSCELDLYEIIDEKNYHLDFPLYTLLAKINTDPITYREAMTIVERKKCREAIELELNAMKKNEVWDIVPRPNKSIDLINTQIDFIYQENS